MRFTAVKNTKPKLNINTNLKKLIICTNMVKIQNIQKFVN